MVQRNDEVFEALKKYVKKNPNANVDNAIEAARKVDSSVDPDDKRSFNARYLLPAKRTAGVAGKKKTKKKAGKKKKTAKKKATSRKTSKRASGGTTTTSKKARQLVLDRDRRIMELASGDLDPKEAYRLAADVGEFLVELKKAL